MSQFGLSAVYVVFEDGTDLYWARSRVLEYLNTARTRLPDGAMPMLGPDATGVGWVMQYVVADTTGTRTLGELRAIQDWTIRPALTAVPGVAEIAALGGFEKQYQIEVDPDRLLAYGLSIDRVVDAIRESNADVGARTLESGGAEYLVRGRGRFAGLADIRDVAIGVGGGGTPVTVRDIATVQIGPELRRGIADLDGRGEIVTGWVVMRYGENPLAVIERVKTRMAELGRALPHGVVFMNGYDRSGLIRSAVRTLREKLVEESIIVGIVTVLFLLHASSALVAIVTVPIGVLLAFLAMRALGLTANIMSLGGIAIAIGAMIDAAVVMVENYHKHLEREGNGGLGLTSSRRWELVAASAREVGPSLFISLLIITLSFVPVFALEAQEGRLFHPLAWTKTLTMAAAALLSLTLVPVSMGLFIRVPVRAEAANPLTRWLIVMYRPVVRLVLRYRWTTLLVAAVVLAGTVFPWSRLGSEFMPPLNEGAIMDMPSLFPGIGTAQARAVLEQRDAALERIPEVDVVLGKIGRAETATDMAPMSMIETIAILKDRSAWRPGVTYDSIVNEANVAVRTPGIANMWSMPIKNRLDMLATGIKTPVGVKIFGPSLDTLDQLGRAVERVLGGVRGTNAVFAERSLGGRYVDVTVDAGAAARVGLTTGAVQRVLGTVVGGAPAGEVYDGRERFSVLVRYPRELRDSPARMGEVIVPTPGLDNVTLGQLARIAVVRGPAVVKSENATPNNVVYIDVRDRDVGSYVAEARQIVQRAVPLPSGYRLEWSGQYEALERASRRLAWVVPITLLIIFLLLYANFRSAGESLLIMLALPFALVGSVWYLWLLDYHLSVAVAVGLIALAGVAAETGVVMLLYLDHAYRDRALAGEMNSRADLDAAVEEGAVERLRPKMMTVTAIMAGLIPILWSEGSGADVMKRIAAPMVGGMVTSTVLVLFVLPVAYSVWRERQLVQLGRLHTRAALDVGPTLATPPA